MPWNVIAQIGEDSYYPPLDPKELRFVGTIDKPGDNHGVAHHLLADVFKAGLLPSQTAIDLLHVAAMAYTADMRIWRGYNGDDAWSGEISIHAPVTDVALWSKAAPRLTELLSFLTGDEWTVEFRDKIPSAPPVVGKRTDPEPDAVCLFSGGLDSFVGAIDLLAANRRLALVATTVIHSASRLQRMKRSSPCTKHRCYRFGSSFVPPRASGEQIVESTMRARSILFLALGTCVASALPAGTPLYVPENGLISLNIPLTFGRAGTHSTRTTHPHTIDLYRKLLDALGIEVALHTPYSAHYEVSIWSNLHTPPSFEAMCH